MLVFVTVAFPEIHSCLSVSCAGPILESKDMHMIFQRKGQKRGKYLKIGIKMYKI